MATDRYTMMNVHGGLRRNLEMAKVAMRGSGARMVSHMTRYLNGA